jgi:hypothetical protein
MRHIQDPNTFQSFSHDHPSSSNIQAHGAPGAF